MQIPLALQSYPAYSKRENSQSLINMYAIFDASSGKTNAALYPTPGLKNLITVAGADSIVAALTLGNLAYFVYKNSSQSRLISVTSAGVVVDIGQVGDQNANISMYAIFDQIMILTGSTAYNYKPSTTTLTAITDPDFPTNASAGASISDYFIALLPNSDTFYVSNLSDGLTWGTLDFAAASVAPDNLVSAAVLYQQLYLFGQTTTEIWSLVAQNFPLASQQGNYLNYGCVAPKSVALANNSLLWLSQSGNGQNLVLQVSSGNNPQIVSTDALTYEFSTYTTVSDAFAYSYQILGHEFYVLTFPTASKTWVYDTMTALWHELQSYNTESAVSATYTRHRSNCYTFLNGLHIVGDFVSGKLFTLDTATYLDDAQYYIPRTIVTPNFSNEGRKIRISSLELFVEPGQGLQSGQGSNPLIGLQISRNAGFTYGNERLRNVGKVGQYRKRVQWNLIGWARDFVFKFTFSEPIPFAMLGLSIDCDLEDSESALKQVPK